MRPWVQVTVLAAVLGGVLMIAACLTPGERRGQRDLEREVEKKSQAADATVPGTPENEAAKTAVEEAKAKLEAYKAQMEVIRRERGVTVASGLETAGGVATGIPYLAFLGPILTLIGGGLRMYSQRAGA